MTYENYDVQLFDSIKKMRDLIQKKEYEHGL